MDRYATACEEVAYVVSVSGICQANIHSRTDANFRATFGNAFHRAVSSTYTLYICSAPLPPLLSIIYMPFIINTYFSEINHAERQGRTISFLP
jgi:hypothetical protein